MNLIDRMAVRWLKRDGLSGIGDVSQYLQWLTENQGKTHAGVSVTESTALGLSYAYACINVLSQTVAHVPLELLERTARGSMAAKSHPLYRLLHDLPNSRNTSFTFRETLEAHRNGWGNAYARINREGIDAVSLDILYPDRTAPKILVDGSIVYETIINNVKTVIPANDVLHIPGLGFDGLIGYSPIRMQRETIGLGLALQRFGNSFFGNGARPSMIFEAAGKINNVEEFKNQINQKFTGSDNWNNTMVLPNGLTAKFVTVNPDDAQFLRRASSTAQK